ncbi:MAG: hypothetical protein Q9217_003872 [Psora testacea]
MVQHVTPTKISGPLQAKRRQLEKEIEDFKSQKEHEYKEYERKLREEGLVSDREGHPRSEEDDRATSTRIREQSPAQRHRETNNKDRNGSSAKRESKSFPTARQELSDVFGGFPGPPYRSQRYGKRREWEGVFTPEYLPLIDGQSNGHVQYSQEDASPSTPSKGATGPPASNLSLTATVSRSSLYTPLLTLSSPHAQLSSSAPPHEDSQDTHHRSDSSASNISVASLRSSMKGPNQLRSPKRVLFSLGDNVVSPSTSPVMARRSANGKTTANRAEGLENVLDWGQNGRGKRNRRKQRSSSADGEEGRGRQGREALEDIGVSESRGFVSLVEGWTKTVPIPKALTTNPATLTTATSNGFENAEKIDDDDLFTFDEDLDASSPKKPANNDPADGNMFDEGEDDHAKESLPGTSPHAGSLPIEIKWPGRKDARGDG